MARKLRSVSGHSNRRRGWPAIRLTSAIGGSEREMLAVLRSKLAAKLDDGGVPTHAFAQLVRQFRAIDRDIRQLDAAAAAVQADEGDEPSAPWDPDAL